MAAACSRRHLAWRPLVGSLLLRRRPAAIRELVVPVVIFAVKSEPWRPLAHIGEEVFKDVPSSADGNATAAVILPFGGLRIRTSLLHASPRLIGWRKEASLGMTVPHMPKWIVFVIDLRIAGAPPSGVVVNTPAMTTLPAY